MHICPCMQTYQNYTYHTYGNLCKTHVCSYICLMLNFHKPKVNIIENQRRNQECTIQRHRQHWAQDTEKKRQAKKKTPQKNKKMSNTDPTIKHI